MTEVTELMEVMELAVAQMLRSPPFRSSVCVEAVWLRSDGADGGTDAPPTAVAVVCVGGSRLAQVIDGADGGDGGDRASRSEGGDAGTDAPPAAALPLSVSVTADWLR